MNTERPLRALIVDDSPDDAALVARALRRTGFDVEWERVDSAPGMRDILRNEDFDLVLSDRSMPGFGALEALGVLRAEAPELPAIVVSGEVHDAVVSELRSAGAREIVHKDRLQHLRGAVESALAGNGTAESSEEPGEEAEPAAPSAPATGLDRAVTAALAGGGPLAPAVERVLELGLGALGASHGILWRTSRDGTRLIAAVQLGSETLTRASATTSLERGRGLPGRAWESHGPVRGSVPEDDPRAADARAAGIEACIAAPVAIGSELLGVVELLGPRLGPHHVEDVVMLAGQLGPHVALAERDARLRAITQTPRTAILVTDRAGRLLFWNPGAEALFGWTAGEALGQSIALVAPAADRESGSGLASIGRPDRPAILDRTVELSAVKKVGGEVPVEVTLSSWEAGGETFYSAIVADVTGRLEAERERERLARRNALILESAAEGICGVDTEGRATFVNPAAARILGYSVDQLVGADLAALVQRDASGMPVAWPEGPLGSSFRDGGVHALRDEVLWRRDGVAVPVELATGPLVEAGELAGSVITFADVSSRKQAEELARLNARLAEVNTELAAVNQELEAFSYSVSHDLRAPLRAIRGFAQALIEDHAGELDREAREHLDRIERASGRMSTMIEELLDLSRASRGEIRAERLDLAVMAREVVDELRAGEPHRSVEVWIADSLPAEGDPQLIRQVVQNLIANAWKFTANEPVARIEMGSLEAEGRTWFYVRDNGAGFDEQAAQKLFVPFQRLHRDEDFQGTGIGLATVQRIVRRHGGEIAARGAVGEGATFYLAL